MNNVITMTVRQLKEAAERLEKLGRADQPVYIQHVNHGRTTREAVLMLIEPGNKFEKGFVWLIGDGVIE